MKPAVFKASYADWKLVKTRACVQIIFEIPVEKANEAYEILGGMPVSANESWFAIARLKQQQEEPTTATEKPAPVSPPVRVPRNRLTTKIAMLCNDSLFRQWLQVNCNLPVATKEDAAALVRHNCGVESRSDIIAGTVPGNRWDIMESAFICWRDRDAFVEQPA